MEDTLNVLVQDLFRQPLPSKQLTPSAGFRSVVLESGEAVGCQNAVTLFPDRVMVCRVPLRQLAGVAPRHQRVLQHCVPFFVPQENMAPLLTRNLRIGMV